MFFGKFEFKISAGTMPLKSAFIFWRKIGRSGSCQISSKSNQTPFIHLLPLFTLVRGSPKRGNARPNFLIPFWSDHAFWDTFASFQLFRISQAAPFFSLILRKYGSNSQTAILATIAQTANINNSMQAFPTTYVCKAFQSNFLFHEITCRIGVLSAFR